MRAIAALVCVASILVAVWSALQQQQRKQPIDSRSI
jgi:hypothetical protein